MGERTRILFVEDELSISQPFAKALTRAGFEAVTAATAVEALELADRIQPDLVLLDLNLPDGDGRDVCRELQRKHAMPVVMLTARGSELDRVVGLELGADDYVVKPFSSAEVIARIRAVLRRAQRDPERLEPMAVGALQVVPDRREVTLDGSELDLTRREYDLLERLMRDAGRVVSREDLLSDVWDANWFGSTKTLDVHVGQLRRKLGDDPAEPAYLRTVRGVGFRMSSPEELAAK